MTVDAPDPAARFAANILVNIPPRPMLEPAPPAMASSARSPAFARSTNLAKGSLRGSAVNKPLVGQNDICIRLYQIGYQGAQSVVVAKFDFVNNDGVVLVDNRYDAVFE